MTKADTRIGPPEAQGGVEADPDKDRERQRPARRRLEGVGFYGPRAEPMAIGDALRNVRGGVQDEVPMWSSPRR